MAKLTELDQRVTLDAQLVGTEGPVILINTFTVDPAEIDQLLDAWTHDAHFMKRQPGFISTQLHRGIAGSGVLINVAVWESVPAFKAAFGAPEFRAMVQQYPPSTVASPHLFQKLAVPGICVA